MRPATWIAIFAGLFQSHCQPPDCAGVGCVHGVDVFAAHDSGAEPGPGVYRVEVIADSTLVACEIDLPAVTSCNDRDHLYVSAYGKNGGGKPSIGIRVGLTPKALEVKVFRAGQPLGNAEYQLSYTHTHLGGDEDEPCAQDCYYGGKHDLTLAE